MFDHNGELEGRMDCYGHIWQNLLKKSLWPKRKGIDKRLFKVITTML